MPHLRLSRRRFLEQLAAAAGLPVGAPLMAACRPWAIGASSSPTRSVSAISSPRQVASDAGLRTAGGRIVDATGSEVRLTGINWFGFETQTFAPHDWKDMLSGYQWPRLRPPSAQPNAG